MIERYETHLFDCDGVLLDSNDCKARGFYNAALSYGREAAEALAAYHRRAGNATRRERVAYFFAEILKVTPIEGEFEEMLAACGQEIRFETRRAMKVPGIEAWLAEIRKAGRAAVCVSGVETPELEDLLRHHGLLSYFDGAYGGPERKGRIMSSLFECGLIKGPAVYYGDTEDDRRQATAEAAIDFVWVWGCSDEQEKGQAYRRRLRDFTEALQIEGQRAGG